MDGFVQIRGLGFEIPRKNSRVFSFPSYESKNSFQSLLQIDDSFHYNITLRKFIKICRNGSSETKNRTEQNRTRRTRTTLGSKLRADSLNFESELYCSGGAIEDVFFNFFIIFHGGRRSNLKNGSSNLSLCKTSVFHFLFLFLFSLKISICIHNDS